MALMFSNLPIDMSEGLDTKNDEFIKSGRDVMENINLSGKGTPSKRNGFDVFTKNITDNPVAVAPFEQVENGNEIYSFRDQIGLSYAQGHALLNEESGTFSRIARQVAPLASAKILKKDSLDNSNSGSFVATASPSWAQNSKIKIVDMGSRFSIYKLDGSIIYKDLSLNTQLKFTVVNDVIYGAYVALSSDLRIVRFEDDGDIVTVVDIGTAYNDGSETRTPFDICSNETHIFVAYHDVSTATQVNVFKTNLSGSTTSTQSFTIANLNRNTMPGIAANSTRVAVGTIGLNTARLTLLDEDLVIIANDQLKITLNTSPSPLQPGVVVVGMTETEGFIGATYDQYDDAVSGFIRFNTATGVNVGGQRISNTLEIMSRPISISGLWYIGASSNRYNEEEARGLGLVEYAFQDYYVLAFNASFFPMSAAYLAKEIAEPITSVQTRFVYASDLELFAIKENDRNFRLFEFSLNRSKVKSHIEYGSACYIPGAQPRKFDGVGLTTIGIHVAPFISGTVASSGSIAAGTYNYIATFIRRDAQGNIEESELENEVTVTLAGSSQVALSIKTGFCESERVSLRIYRKLQTEVTYRLALETPVDIPFSATTFVDNKASLAGEEAFYGTGGTLENNALLACLDIAYHQGRFFAVDATDFNILRFSKPYLKGLAAEFNDFQFIEVEDSQGRATGALNAVTSLDNKLALLKSNSVCVLFGEGPDGTGEGGTFSRPEVVSTETGCTNARSVVVAASGVLFQGDKGIYALGRGLGVSYIGADVEAFNDLEITSASLMLNNNQIRFGTRDGETLVFNYATEKWTTYKNYQQVSGLFTRGRFYHLNLTGNVCRENDGFLDGSSFIPMKIKTGWIKTDTLQGFARVQKVLIMGRFKSPHNLRLRIAYDFQDYDWTEYILTPGTGYNSTTKPEIVPYQDGSNDGVYRWEVHLIKQKCKSLNITIEDVETTSPGASFDLSSIQLRVGLKAGTFKFSEAKKA